MFLYCFFFKAILNFKLCCSYVILRDDKPPIQFGMYVTMVPGFAHLEVAIQHIARVKENIIKVVMGMLNGPHTFL